MPAYYETTLGPCFTVFVEQYVKMLKTAQIQIHFVWECQFGLKFVDARYSIGVKHFCVA